MKLAFLSMDVEDWHHTTYLPRQPRTPAVSMLDGVEEFAHALEQQGVPATFFTLSEVARGMAGTLRALRAAGHEIACHGDDHTLPNRISLTEFRARMIAARMEIEDAIGDAVVGYRAPCFAIDEARLLELPAAGFRYDASWIRFAGHSLYGSMDLSGWQEAAPGVRVSPGGGFLEFEVPSLPWRSWYLPVAGGGSFRLIPWRLMRRWISAFLETGRPYMFYIHPFECSNASARLPLRTSVSNRLRFHVGRTQVQHRLVGLIALLREHGYRFVTHSEAVRSMRDVRQDPGTPIVQGPV